jgi:hypothetical protein
MSRSKVEIARATSGTADFSLFDHHKSSTAATKMDVAAPNRIALASKKLASREP